MAKIDIININGNKQPCVNLSYTVGAGGGNHKKESSGFFIRLK